MNEQNEKIKFKLDKKHVQGFAAGILVSIIAFTGLLAGFNPGFLTGAMGDSESIICDITYGDVILQYPKPNRSLDVTHTVPGRGQITQSAIGNPEIIIIGSTSEYKITVGYKVSYSKITLDGVNIQAPALSPAILLSQYSDVKLTLKNDNKLLSHGSYPALFTDSDSKLIICGPGSLTAIGGNGAPGIGNRLVFSNANNTMITIESGTINAVGGYGAAGIGGGMRSWIRWININGGTINATGGKGAEGIGRGYLASENVSVAITGGTVVATGGKGAKGIYNPLNAPYGGNVTVIDG